MIRHRHLDKLIILLVGIAVILTVLVMNKTIQVPSASMNPPYVDKLFNQNKVHSIDIEIEDWENLLENALEEQYYPATLHINGETFENVGLRTKGNNSLRLTHRYGHDRYSLKIEMDHYYDLSYYGLDKFSLDASFQDNAYLKTYMAMDMMRTLGVATPLVNYTWVRVNGEDWGLFLAVEEPEEAFARRNYGRNYGQLYKPDYKRLADENNDVALIYTTDEIDDYDNIFRNAKFHPTKADKRRLINSLKILGSKEQLDQAVDIEQVLRYFVVQVFVVNMDSYLGHTGHNYFLYEKDGLLSMLPWDYNLAFATYSLGMPNPINDSTLYINFPIDTPYHGETMVRRPLYHHLMLDQTYFRQYRQYFDQFISHYFESGMFEEKVQAVTNLIDPYVEKDPTKFISYEDYILAVQTFTDFNLLRAQSVRKQLQKEIPSTIKGQAQNRLNFVDGSSVWLPDMGEIADLKDDGFPFRETP